MARIRTIKPEFFRHYDLFEAEHETGLPLRVAFAALWCVADREGRFKWRPMELKVECLPYDDIDFSRVLDALATRGFLVRYRVGTRAFGWIPGFRKHQVINNREKASDLPSPDEGEKDEPIENKDLLTRDTRVDDALATRGSRRESGKEGKGKEGKGKEGEDTPPDGGSSDTEYRWQGHVIRLTGCDFDRWQQSFRHLDLAAELESLDAWLSSDDATDSNRKRWFHVVAGALKNRNGDAEAKARATPPKDINPVFTL